MKIILLVLLVLVIAGLAPIALIWSMNTLFHTNIQVTFTTWVATLILASVFSGHASKGNK